MIQDIRKRILFWASIAVGIILAIILIIIALRNRPTTTPTTTGETGTTIPGVSMPSTPTPPATTSPRVTKPVGTPEEIYLLQLSRMFVERFGSYSNQNDNSHIVDTLSLASASMQKYMLTQSVKANMVYHGVTTVVVAEKVEKKTATTASVHIDVQRVISDGTNSTTAYQSGRVQLVLENKEWKVDGVFWTK